MEVGTRLSLFVAYILFEKCIVRLLDRHSRPPGFTFYGKSLIPFVDGFPFIQI